MAAGENHGNPAQEAVRQGSRRLVHRGRLGEPIVTIRPGDVVHTPAGEWHWHGATPAHLMTHLAMTEGDAAWGEHVTDGEYSGRREAAGGREG